MRTPQVTIKTTPTAHQLLRLIAEATGEKHYAVLERVLRKELARIQKISVIRIIPND